MFFLGEIVCSNDFEGLYFIGKIINCCGYEVDDFVIDDSVIVYISFEGIVIIIGCFYFGICNIIDYVIKVIGDKCIWVVIGGFYLLNVEIFIFIRIFDYFK